jgi:hypothetical protein
LHFLSATVLTCLVTGAVWVACQSECIVHEPVLQYSLQTAINRSKKMECTAALSAEERWCLNGCCHQWRLIQSTQPYHGSNLNQTDTTTTCRTQQPIMNTPSLIPWHTAPPTCMPCVHAALTITRRDHACAVQGFSWHVAAAQVLAAVDRLLCTVLGPSIYGAVIAQPPVRSQFD